MIAGLLLFAAQSLSSPWPPPPADPMKAECSAAHAAHSDASDWVHRALETYRTCVDASGTGDRCTAQFDDVTAADKRLNETIDEVETMCRD